MTVSNNSNRAEIFYLIILYQFHVLLLMFIYLFFRGAGVLLLLLFLVVLFNWCSSKVAPQNAGQTFQTFHRWSDEHGLDKTEYRDLKEKRDEKFMENFYLKYKNRLPDTGVCEPVEFDEQKACGTEQKYAEANKSKHTQPKCM